TIGACRRTNTSSSRGSRLRRKASSSWLSVRSAPSCSRAERRKFWSTNHMGLFGTSLLAGKTFAAPIISTGSRPSDRCFFDGADKRSPGKTTRAEGPRSASRPANTCCCAGFQALPSIGHLTRLQFPFRHFVRNRRHLHRSCSQRRYQVPDQAG